MSVGCGAGIFEKFLLKHCNLQLNYFHAVEPDQPRLNQLVNTLESGTNGVKVNIEVTHKQFDGSFNTDHRFDLILFHPRSLCESSDTTQCLLLARSFLKPRGQICLLHQSGIKCLKTKCDALTTINGAKADSKRMLGHMQLVHMLKV